MTAKTPGRDPGDIESGGRAATDVLAAGQQSPNPVQEWFEVDPDGPFKSARRPVRLGCLLGQEAVCWVVAEEHLAYEVIGREVRGGDGLDSVLVVQMSPRLLSGDQLARLCAASIAWSRTVESSSAGMSLSKRSSPARPEGGS